MFNVIPILQMFLKPEQRICASSAINPVNRQDFPSGILTLPRED